MDVPAVAVIGTGSIGMVHLRAIRDGLGLKALAVPVRPERRAALIAEGFPVASDVRDAAGAGARLCVIATETARHAVDALAALDAGCDVLLEKPLARDAGDAQPVCAAAVAKGRRVAVGCCLRFASGLGLFRDRLPDIGSVHSVRIECQSYLPEWRPGRPYQASYSARPEEGGVLRDVIHEIDYAGWLFGWPSRVYARVRNLGRLGIGAEEAADLTWETGGGAVVSLALDYLSRPRRRRLWAGGEWGALEWNAVAGTVALTLAAGTPSITHVTDTPEGMVLAQDRAFVAACLGADDVRLASCREGLRALAVCDAARRSALSGREEPVEYP